MPLLQLDVLSDIHHLEQLASEWLALMGRCPSCTPFQSPEWILPWWRYLGGGELSTLAWWREDHLVGLAPLFIHNWEGRRQISPLGVSFSDMFDLLYEPEFGVQATPSLFEFLADSSSRWDICILPELAQTSPLLSAEIPDSLQAQVQPLDVSPVLALPASAEEHEALISPHLRRNLKRAKRMLEKLGGKIVEASTPALVQEFMEALFRLHALRWQAQGQTGVLADERVQAFHREAAQGLFARGMLRFYGIRRGGTLAAVAYGFGDGGRAYAYLGGLEHEVARASPGMLLTYHAIQEAIREGCGEFDFLRGKEEYKYNWGARDRQNYRLVLTHDKRR